MKVIRRDILDDFGHHHTDCISSIRAWLSEVEAASWSKAADLKARYATASFITGTRVVFNIKGNNYRLDIQINYATQLVVIKRMGTHAEYSNWKY